MDSGVDDWIYWHFFTFRVDYNSSHIEVLLNNICLTNLSEESLAALWILDWSLLPRIEFESESESESYVTTDGQSASLSWYKAPIWGLRPDFFIAVGQLRLCWYGALSLTRGRVCRLQLLLVLDSAIILRSESPWDSRPYFTVSDLRLLLSVIVGSIVHCHL
jgi:hypothetical protein